MKDAKSHRPRQTPLREVNFAVSNRKFEPISAKKMQEILADGNSQEPAIINKVKVRRSHKKSPEQ